MTSSASNSLTDKTYYSNRERMDTGHWALGTLFVNRKQICALRVMRQHMEEQP